jgi:membrane associated rhomboid family serine protease
MFPVRDNLVSQERAYVTWTLVLLNAAVYVWDRGGHAFGPGTAFTDLAATPSEVVMAIRGQSGDVAELGKLYTSMFLHGNVAHILGNVLFLAVFGPSIELALGGLRFAVYYLFWGLVAAAAHIFVDPGSEASFLGASGAIGGVLGSYFLVFPGSRVKVVIVPVLWTTFTLPAWLLLGLWFLAQVFVPQPGVATWAHAGGFMAGMATVLILGGRQPVLDGAPLQEDALFDED